MTVQLERPAISTQPVAEAKEFADFALDISIVEGGPSADQLIRMTDDGCNSTCATACTSCPA
ncbi:FxLD family lanthipeptide [Streptomyces sp. VNUA24]|uniref:FxLD family lanthipeptide n=1 Tax=Streptomyces sp. VNUA24 TaxID=3031131 RepID=UPI0023B86838|nr:FxLD family lanthipeptide [Streptomyces sp. VNUA24]WEH18125.1 FxLD family lanthipeptide [Streptomyces sp. VNUA24]